MVSAGTAIDAKTILDNVASNRDLVLSAYANLDCSELFVAGDQSISMNNTTNNTVIPATTAPQQQAATSTVPPLQTFTVPNAIQQSALVQQIPIPPSPQPILNVIPTLPIQTEALRQNLFAQQQQQHHHQQIQQLQQQLQLQQLAQVQQVQHQQLQMAQYQQLQLVQQHQLLQQQQQQVQYPILNLSQQIPVVVPPVSIIHNLIPEHLRPFALAASMNGTTGYAPALILPKNNDPNYVNAVNNMILLAAATSSPVNNASAVAAATQLNAALFGTPQLIPQQQQQQQQQQQPVVSIPLTVQDRPSVPPVFNGVNLAYPGVEALGMDPPIYLVRDFLTHAECDFLIGAADGVWQPAPVVGKGAGEISPSRTSSTCFLAREDLPDYMRKISALTSKPIEHCELPQVGRYLPTQQYRHHFDAFDLSNNDGLRFAGNGGQRVVTVLVYLNDCVQGGQTDFPLMNLQVAPRKGTAVVFFPATVDGYLDKRALHAALPAVDTKYVSQVWIRQGNYTGSPSKRLIQPMINVSYS